MGNYLFETEDFGISEKGIHLLRSRFNYETIEYSSIEEIIFDRGRQVGNWLLSLSVGIVLFLGGIWWSARIFYEFFFGDSTIKFHVLEFAAPIFPVFLGVFLLFYSFKTGFILKIRTNGKTKIFLLEALKKESQMGPMIKYFAGNKLVNYKLKVNFDAPKHQ